MNQCFGITNKGERCKQKLKNKAFCSRHCPAPHWNEIPTECPICRDEISPEKSMLSCGHYIHWNCLDKWEKGYKCPLCNEDLPEFSRRKRSCNLSSASVRSYPFDWDEIETVDFENSPSRISITINIPSDGQDLLLTLLREYYHEVITEPSLSL